MMTDAAAELFGHTRNDDEAELRYAAPMFGTGDGAAADGALMDFIANAGPVSTTSILTPSFDAERWSMAG